MKKITNVDVLRYCVFFIFIGRAYQFMFFGAPFRAFFWDESLLSPVIENVFGISWYDYSTSLEVNYWIEALTKACGVVLFISGITALLWDKIQNIFFKRGILKIGIVILLILTFLIFKSKNFRLLEVFEMLIQLSLPIALILSFKIHPRHISLFLKIAISLTFIAHGLYAMGIPFRPGHFIDMTIGITGLNEDQSKIFLTVAGALDIVAAVLIYFKRTVRVGLLYIFIWGLLTALARVVYGFNMSFALDSIHNSLYSTIYRLPHGLIALAVFLLIFSSLKNKNTPDYET